MKNKGLRITLKIAGREYPLTIDPEEEWKYRQAAKEINELVTLYGKRYSADMENYLAMAALQIALLGLSRQAARELEPLVEELRDLDSKIAELTDGILTDTERAKKKTAELRNLGEGSR